MPGAGAARGARAPASAAPTCTSRPASIRAAPPVTMGHEVCGRRGGRRRRRGRGAGRRARRLRDVLLAPAARASSAATGARTCARAALDRLVRRRRLRRAGRGAGARASTAIPDWLDEHAAALTEPLACVCQCLCDPPAVTAGDRVLVTGPGPDRPARRAGRAGAGRRRARRRPAAPTRRGWRSREQLGLATAHAAPDAGERLRRGRSSARAAAGRRAACLEAAGRGGALRAGRRVREARDRAARPRLREGARRDARGSPRRRAPGGGRWR